MDSFQAHSDKSSSPDASSSSVVSRFTTPELDGSSSTSRCIAPWDRRLEEPPAATAWYEHQQTTTRWTAAGGELPAMGDRHPLHGMGQQLRHFGTLDARGQQQQQHQYQHPQRLQQPPVFAGSAPGRTPTSARFLDSVNWRNAGALAAADLGVPMSSAVNQPFSHAPWAQQQQQQQQQLQAQTQTQHRPQTSNPALDDIYAYCFERGDGSYTRLIPADMLPPLTNIPSLQQGCEGMFVLPLPPRSPPRGPLSNIEPVTLQKTPPSSPAPGSDTIQKKIDHIVASSPTPQKRPKIYCDKWVHEGVCAFTQQGCKYKHEMPLDKATQMSLGLFHGLPTWWKKQQAERQREDTSGAAEEVAPAAASFEAGCDGKEEQYHQRSVSASLTKTQQGPSWRRGDVAGGMLPLSPAAYGAAVNGLRSSGNPFSRQAPSPTSHCAFGPIGPPPRFNNTSDSSQTTDYAAAMVGRTGDGGTRSFRGPDAFGAARVLSEQEDERARMEQLRLG